MALGVPKSCTYFGSQEQFGNERVMSREVASGTKEFDGWIALNYSLLGQEPTARQKYAGGKAVPGCLLSVT